MGKVLMVVAPERFRDEELFETRAVLTAAGHAITVASTRAGRCPGSRGGHVDVALTLDKARSADYDAVVFVGGGGSKLLFNDPSALRIAREIARAGRVLAAICLAPVILANAGVQATVAGTEARTLETAGARYTGLGVTVDGMLVTANGPKSSHLFGERIAELLAAATPADKLRPSAESRPRLRPGSIADERGK
jgi:protease I